MTPDKKDYYKGLVKAVFEDAVRMPLQLPKGIHNLFSEELNAPEKVSNAAALITAGCLILVGVADAIQNGLASGIGNVYMASNAAAAILYCLDKVTEEDSHKHICPQIAAFEENHTASNKPKDLTL